MKDFQKSIPLINSIIILIIICFISVLTITLFSCKLPLAPNDSKGPDSIDAGPDESDLNTIKGSGNIKSIEIDVKDFNKVVVSGEGILIIEQGDAEGLIIKTDDNLLEYIKATVTGSELKIDNIVKIGDDLVPSDSIYYYLKVKDLLELGLPGVVKVESENIQLNSLNLLMSGVSDVELIGEIDSLNIVIDNIGNFKGRDFFCKKCVISGNGTVNIIVSVEEKLDIDLKGTGSIKYIGNPEINQDVGDLVNVEKIN
ncbi:GIN domain-containing protein [Actinomycetota bacterium]